MQSLVYRLISWWNSRLNYLRSCNQVGMSKFHKPKKNPAEGPHYDELARVAVTRALQDCCLKPSDIEQVRKKAPGFRLPYSHTRCIFISMLLAFVSCSNWIFVYLFISRPSLATCLLVAERAKDRYVRVEPYLWLLWLLSFVCRTRTTQMQWAFLTSPFTMWPMRG